MPIPGSRTLAAGLLALAALAFCAPGAAQAQRRCVVAEVIIQPGEAEVPVGTEYALIPTAYDRASNPCESAAFIWTSSNPAIASVSADGRVQGLTPGQVTVTVRSGTGAAAKTATARVTVIEGNIETQGRSGSAIPDFNRVPNRPTLPGYAAFDRQPDGTGPAEGLYVDPLTLVLVRGEWRDIKFRAMRGNENAARVPIQFSVDPGGERIIAVDSLGLVTSLGDTGATNVRLTVPGQTRIPVKVVRVEVKPDPLRFNKVQFSLAPGAVETLSVYIASQSRPLNNPEMFQFRSSDTTRVRVNPLNPIVTAVAPGMARITVEGGPHPPFAAIVRVHAPVATVRIEPNDSMRTIAIGGTTTVRAAALATDGSPVAGVPYTWEVSDTNLVRYDTATGLVTGRRSGTATITVQVPTTGEQATRHSVRVLVVAGSMSVPRTRFGMGIGETLPLEVSVLNEARRPIMPANPFLTWTVSPDSVLRVEGGTQIVAQKPGRARVTGRATWDTTVTMDVFVVGEVLVVGQNQGQRDLLMKWNMGQNWSPLTTDTLVERQGVWSPDLTWIAFTVQRPTLRDRRETAELFFMQADGTGRVRMRHDSALVQFPAFTPNGDRIIFESNRSNRVQQIWSVAVLGDSLGAPRQLTNALPGAPSTAPSVSRDGRRIAYASFRDVAGQQIWGIYQSNLDGGEETGPRVTARRGRKVDQPVYAPDGRTLYFLRNETDRPAWQRVYKVSIEPGATDTAMAVTPANLFVLSYSLSGDGTQLALATQEILPGQQQPVSRVHLFNIATGQATTIDSPEERLLSPSLRPATQRPAAPPNR